MNAATANRELVRLLVLEHGQKRAAELSGVAYETVRKWTQRGKWLAVPNVPNMPTAARIVDNVANELQDNEKQTRLSLSRYTARAAKDAEKCNLVHAPIVKALADTAAKTYPDWMPERKGEQAQVAVNIAILGV